MNMFIARLTIFAPLLAQSVSVMGASERKWCVDCFFGTGHSLEFAHPLEWESKRGKWNKRWLRLREHSLWISKRDNVRGVFFALLLKVHLMYIPHTTGERRDALVFFIQL